MRAGVVVNPSAGKMKTIAQKLSKLEEIFDEVFTGPGRFGGDFLKSSRIVEVTTEGFKEAIRRLVLEFLKNVDVIVSVGGDGTANLVAEVLIDESIDIPVMGIAGGTANVGPLIRFSLDDLKGPYRIEKVNCLKVLHGGEKVGYAFVDVVFGDTFLGTLNGRMVNLDAKAFIEKGLKVPKRPRNNIARELKVYRGGEEIEIRMGQISQLIASPINFPGFYIGKAITGALCWARFFDLIGLLVFSSRVIVDSGVTEESAKDPLVLVQISFSEGEPVVLEGFNRGVFAILDGNPACECEKPIILVGLKDCVKVIVGPGERILPVGGMSE